MLLLTTETRAIRVLCALKQRLRCESGFALPTVMAVLIAAFGLASVTVVASVNSQSGVVRDQDTKSAIGVAEAGVANAMLRYNRISTSTNPCAPVTAAQGTLGQWCPVQVSGSIGAGTYTYSVLPTRTTAPIQDVITVVSTGNVDGVTRRVKAVSRSSDAYQPFFAASIIADKGITIPANSSITTGGIASNGDIALTQNNSSLYCDQASVAPGYAITGPGGSGCTAVSQTTSLPDVNPGDVHTNPDSNSNERICAPQGDPVVKASCSQVWNPTTRVLDLKVSQSSITFGSPGGEFNYSLCRMVTSKPGTSIYIAAGATVRFYFDSPQNCGFTGPTTQFDLTQNSTIGGTGGSSAYRVSMLFQGWGPQVEPPWSRIYLSSNTSANQQCPSEFIIYAPHSDVEFKQNSNYCGAIAANRITMQQNVQVTGNDAGGDFQLPNTLQQQYTQEEFVECAAAPASPPDTGC